MKPIIQSLLDIDFYKFTMGQFAWLKYPSVVARYELRNRTDVKLGEFLDIGEIREQIAAVQDLRFTPQDLHYLRGVNLFDRNMFQNDYLASLHHMPLPKPEVHFVDEKLHCSVEGLWHEAIYWETILLSIINELYYRSITKRMGSFRQDRLRAEGIIRLDEKIDKLKSMDKELNLVDFGTRRRFSREWQRYVVSAMIEQLRWNFVGTSNVLLAKEFGITPVGTYAHELDMVIFALAMERFGYLPAGAGQVKAWVFDVIRQWIELYGPGLAIALPDTFGSNFYFDNIGLNYVEELRGFRHDSGDPVQFGEKVLAFFNSCPSQSANAKDKLLVFSDGLKVDDIIFLYTYFKDYINTSFGWGTNLTNDLGLKALSLVIKVVSACRSYNSPNLIDTVKLSDNPAKMMGDETTCKRAMEIFDYKAGEVQYKKCEY